jgi:hypothetical protein
MPRAKAQVKYAKRKAMARAWARVMWRPRTTAKGTVNWNARVMTRAGSGMARGLRAE